MRPPEERIKLLEIMRKLIDNFREEFICHALHRAWLSNQELRQAADEIEAEIVRGLDHYDTLEQWVNAERGQLHDYHTLVLCRLAWIDRLIKYEQDLIKIMAKPNNGDPFA